ncbi:MAG: OmpH family outer membrane protein [Bacteroidales bacterium]|nr:OmpH family outer membrane protein [Bacteroidales bacterium]MDE7073155.1 OmpH family outer membrane protein [Bacteroidales bacterium]
MNKNVFKISVLCLSVGMLTCGCGQKGPATGKDVAVSVAEAGIPVSGLTIATVNIDSINQGYQMVADIQQELVRTESRLTADIQNQANAFQKEYDNYLKIGATLTLSEQHKREEQLQQKQQSIAELQQTYANQLVSLQAQRMEEVSNSILSFIEKFNRENGQFGMIVSTGKQSGVLYSLPSMDITSAVLRGLNEEYAAEKASRK